MEESDLKRKYMSAMHKIKQRIEKGTQKPLKFALSALLLFSSNMEVGTASANEIDRFRDNIELIKPPSLVQIQSIETLTDSISQMSFKEVLSNRLINIDDIKNYNFSTEDLKHLKPSILSKKLRNELYKNLNKKPQGKCLSGVREACNRAYNHDVYSPNKMACGWHKAVEKSDLPFVFIGSVNVKNENGCLVDHGNIKLQDLKVLDGAVVIISGGSGQPAGHVAGVYQHGAEVIGCSDGKENWINVVDTKIGGGHRRYGNEAQVMICHDTKIPKGLAKEIAQNIKDHENDYICSTENNRLKISKKDNDTDKGAEILFAHDNDKTKQANIQTATYIKNQKARNA